MIDEIPGLKGLVTRKLLETPKASVREIRDLALARYPAAEALSVRDFGVKYVLPLKRRMGGAALRGPSPVPTAARDPDEAPLREVPPARTGRSGMPLLDAAIAYRRRTQFVVAASLPSPRTERSPRSAAGSRGPGDEPLRSGGSVSDASAVDAFGAQAVGTEARRASKARLGAAGSAKTEPAERTPPAGSESPERTTSPGPERAPPAFSRTESLPSRAGSAPGGAFSRERRARLRTLFLRLAVELAGAETDSELIDVFAALDRYVDEALALAA